MANRTASIRGSDRSPALTGGYRARRPRRLSLLGALLALAAPYALAAGPAAVVEFSSGDDIVVIRDSKRLPFSDPIGLELNEGDQVQTGKGVFMELRLASGGSVIKLAENTTFVLERASDGRTAARLVYGRLRAKVERLAGSDTFSIASAQAVAGVRGTDFGMDVVAGRASARAAAATVTTAYCFEGAIEVTAYVRSDAQAAESLEAIPRVFAVAAGEMLRVEGNEERTEARKSSLEKTIETYWRQNDYVSQSPAATGPEPAASVADEEPAIAATAGTEALEEAFREGRARGAAEAREEAAARMAALEAEARKAASLERALRLKKAGAGIGLGICVTGGGLALSGYLLAASDPALGQALLHAGAVTSASALPFLALTLFF